MLLLTDILDILLDASSQLLHDNFFKPIFFLILLSLALAIYGKDKFRKLSIIVTVAAQALLFILAGVFLSEGCGGGFICVPVGQIVGTALNFTAGVIGLLAWWRFKRPEHSLKWLLITSVGFLLVFPPWFVQTKFLKLVFEPAQKYLGERVAKQHQAIDDKVWADEKEKAKKDYPELLREFEMPQRVTAVNYDLKNEYQSSETGVIRIVSNDGSPKYLFLWRPISGELNVNQIDQFNKYLETILNQEVVVELPTLDRFTGYYWENSLTLSIPTDSKYFYIPIQEIIVNGVRIYDKFCSMNNCVQGFY